MRVQVEAMSTEPIPIGLDDSLSGLLKELSRVDDEQVFTNERTPLNMMIIDDGDGYFFVNFGDIEERLDVLNIAKAALENIPVEFRPLLYHDRIHFRIKDRSGKDIGEELLNSGLVPFGDVVTQLLDIKRDQDICYLHFLHVDEGFFGFHLHNIKLFP